MRNILVPSLLDLVIPEGSFSNFCKPRKEIPIPFLSFLWATVEAPRRTFNGKSSAVFDICEKSNIVIKKIVTISQ